MLKLSQGLNRTGAAARSAIVVSRVSMLLVLVSAAAIVAVGAASLEAYDAHADAAGLLVNESPCIPDMEIGAHPPRILLGESVDITMRVRLVCAGERLPTHVVLVLDASSNMYGPPTRRMKLAATEFIRSLELDQYPAVKVGVAEFSSRGRMLSVLTNEERRAVNAVNRAGAEGEARIDLGIQEGSRVMRRGRGDYGDITEVMILMSNGHSESSDGQVLAAARQAKSQGILLIAVGVGPDCDESLMRRIASSPRYYFRVENMGVMRRLFEGIHDRVLNIFVRKLVVKDTLSPNLQYVPGSAVPKQSEPPSPTNWLQWTDWSVPKEGVTYTFKARPVVPGYLPVYDEARGELTDNKGRTKDWAFEVPWITVLRPSVLTTPDWTATATSLPSATPSRAPTATPTTRHRSLWLPSVVQAVR